VSGFDRAVVLPTPFAGKKLVVIRNGVEAVELLEKEVARNTLFSLQENSSHADDSWVLTSAELNDNKNLFTGIDVLALYNARNSRKAFWSIMGEGEELQNLEEYARTRGVDHQMKFLGYVPEGRASFSAFDAFFLPSKKEGLPYVLLEAGLASLPVATTAVGGIPELIGNGVEGGIGSPRDIEALTEVLELSLQHPEWGRALKTKVEREYGMDQMVSETTALYASAK
jgi:glycosyltransferase involved in cell wall biosynthesis